MTVSLSAPAPTEYPPLTGSPYSLTYAIPPAEGWTTINPSDFAAVFEDYASLDKVPIFNLLATPGITASGVTSEAVAYCERKRAFYIMDTPSPLPSRRLGRPRPRSPDWNVNSRSARPPSCRKTSRSVSTPRSTTHG